MDVLNTIPKPPEPLGEGKKMVLCLWVAFCVFGFVWFAKKMVRGREQMRQNFASIEAQLKRLQRQLEEEEEVAAVEDAADKKED